MVIAFVILAVFLIGICVVLCVATNGEAWWFSLFCVALYALTIVNAHLVREKRRNKPKTCVDCKYYDVRCCWCNLHGFDKDYLGEPCEKFKSREGTENDRTTTQSHSKP